MSRMRFLRWPAACKPRLEAALKKVLETTLPPSPEPPRLTDFPIRVSDVIRFGDLDRQGHVNNAVFATYFESGRVGLIYDPENGLQVPGATSVVARLEVNFLRELHWPARSRSARRSPRSGAAPISLPMRSSARARARRPAAPPWS